MTKNENFNMIIKKFVLNEGLIAAIVVGYILGGGCTFIGFMGYACETIVDLQICSLGIFILIIAGAFNCLWYCLQKYDRMYGLFNGWEDGCDICKQLIKIRNSFDTAKDYKIVFNNHLSNKKHIIEAKGHPIYCPNCGRKLISFSGPRYW